MFLYFLMSVSYLYYFLVCESYKWSVSLIKYTSVWYSSSFNEKLPLSYFETRPICRKIYFFSPHSYFLQFIIQKKFFIYF